ncbi:MAG: S41 family peptidase [Bacteroidales bacterium]
MNNTKLRKLLIACTVTALGFFTVSFTDKHNFELAKNLEIYFNVIKELDINYVDEIEPEKLITKSIEEMLSSLDPYTNYISEEDMEDFNFMTTGEYAGIGSIITRGQDSTVYIAEPYEGKPAQKAGLKAGDKIISVQGKSTKGMDVADVSSLLKGAANENVEIIVRRYGEKKDRTFNVLREVVSISPVPYYGMVDNKVGYVKFTSFTENCSSVLKDAIKALTDSLGAESIILDLRDNGGGLLHESVKICNFFIPKNKEVVSTRGKMKAQDRTFYTKEEPLWADMPIAVLVNGSSASAAEIVSGTIQDFDRGVLIGNRTFGKGLVQTTRDVGYNSQIKLTTAKYYIASGRCIQALDYSHRNSDGSVDHVSDSLISEFKTDNGRIVYDGGGIVPDEIVKLPKFSKISFELINASLFFEYANKFCYETPSIASPDNFKITDEIYRDFIAFVKNKDFSYQSRTDSKIKDLIKTAKDEKYYDIAKDDIEKLEATLSHDIEKDMMLFQDEIKLILKEELVGRYYYQKGVIKSLLSDDIQLAKAKEILNNKEQYDNYFAKGTVIKDKKTSSDNE